jgi:hypothetical protein
VAAHYAHEDVLERFRAGQQLGHGSQFHQPDVVDRWTQFVEGRAEVGDCSIRPGRDTDWLFSGASLEVGGHFKGHDAGCQTQIDTGGREALRSSRIHHD